MSHQYDFHQIPSSWHFCFNRECPLNMKCLRYQVALELPENRQSGNAIFPNAFRDKDCRYFRSNEPVHLATGFVNSHNPVMHQAFITLRRQIEHVTGGGGSYYLYRNGKRWLTPLQQEQIRELFAKAGYPEPIYDQYHDGYDFS